MNALKLITVTAFSLSLIACGGSTDTKPTTGSDSGNLLGGGSDGGSVVNQGGSNATSFTSLNEIEITQLEVLYAGYDQTNFLDKMISETDGNWQRGLNYCDNWAYVYGAQYANKQDIGSLINKTQIYTNTDACFLKDRSGKNKTFGMAFEKVANHDLISTLALARSSNILPSDFDALLGPGTKMGDRSGPSRGFDRSKLPSVADYKKAEGDLIAAIKALPEYAAADALIDKDVAETTKEYFKEIRVAGSLQAKDFAKIRERVKLNLALNNAMINAGWFDGTDENDLGAAVVLYSEGNTLSVVLTQRQTTSTTL